jgi:hypothetical protein
MSFLIFVQLGRWTPEHSPSFYFKLDVRKRKGIKATNLGPCHIRKGQRYQYHRKPAAVVRKKFQEQIKQAIKKLKNLNTKAARRRDKTAYI